MNHLPRAGMRSGLLSLLALSTVVGLAAAADREPQKYWAYVGTYTQRGSKGIYRFAFDPATGRLAGGELAAEAVNPSFLAITPDRKFLYAVAEVGDFHGGKTGAVAAFAVDARTGALAPLNQESSGGAGPCHLVVDRAGRHVLVANYGDGSAAVLPIGPDGRLGPPSSVVHHRGSGPNPGRQEGPHAHSINLDAANRFAVVADLGLDKVMVYRFDAERGTLTPNDPPAAAVAPGAGPRHFAFHPNGRAAYVINELNSTVTAFRYDAARGVLTPVQTVSTLPPGFRGENFPAEVQVHPSGRFLYGSNRGRNSIAVFAIDPASGRLTPAGDQASGIKNPRNFAIDPTGKYLLVANQDSDSVVTFGIDSATGKLRPTGHAMKVPMPVCIKLMPVRD